MIEVIIGPTIGICLGTAIDVTIGETTISLMKDGTTTCKTIEEIVTDKTTETDKITEEMIPDRGIGTEVRIGIDQETIVVTMPGVEIEIERDRCNKEPELYQMTETYLVLGPIQE